MHKVGTLLYMTSEMRKRFADWYPEGTRFAVVATPVQEETQSAWSVTTGQRLWIAERKQYEFWELSDLRKYWTTKEP